MTAWVGFIRTTIIGGIVFLVPFIVLVFILGKAFQIMVHVAAPISSAFPFATVGDIALIQVIAAALILLVCFLAGLVARAGLADRLTRGLEERILSRVPFYHFVKGLTSSVAEAEQDQSIKPVLARFDDHAQIAFEIERTDGGDIVVYLPGAPNPWSGSVCVMTADQVTPLEASMLAVLQNIKQLGKGTKSLL